MANPLVAEITKGSWVKVATNVTAGVIHVLKFDAMYQQTYRLTGDPAPTLQTEGSQMSRDGAEISALVGIDVYIWCSSADGKVRVDV